MAVRSASLVRIAVLIGLCLFAASATPASADTEGRIGSCGSKALDTFSNPDGSMFVLGNAWMCGDVYLDVFFKLKADGTVDKSWSDGGFKALPENISAWKAAVGGGRLTFIFGESVFRFAQDGSPDTNFGTDGEASMVSSFGGRLIQDLAIDSQGRTLLVASNGSPAELIVARLDAGGELDDSFGVEGIANPTVPENGFPFYGFRITTDSQDRVVVAGNAGFVIRLNSQGEPDISFGPADDGIANAVIPPYTNDLADVTTGSDDRIQLFFDGGDPLLRDCDYAGAALAMLDVDGAPLGDTSALFDCGKTDLAPVELDGNQLMAVSGTGPYMGPDPASFIVGLGSGPGTGWTRSVPIGPAYGAANSVEYQAGHNRIVAAGVAHGGDCSTRWCHGNSRMAIAAFDPDGHLDSSFGIGGVAYFPSVRCKRGNVGLGLIPAWKKCRISPLSIRGTARLRGRNDPTLKVNAAVVSLPEQPGGIGQRLIVRLPSELRLKKPLARERIVVSRPESGTIKTKVTGRRVELTYWPEPPEYPEIQSGQKNEGVRISLRIKRGSFKPLPPKASFWRMSVPVRAVGLPGVPGSRSESSNLGNWFAPNHSDFHLRVRR